MTDEARMPKKYTVKYSQAAGGQEMEICTNPERQVVRVNLRCSVAPNVLEGPRFGTLLIGSSWRLEF
jgi:hypothetical protein